MDRSSGSSVHLITMMRPCLHWSGSLQPIKEGWVLGLEQHFSPEQRIPSDSVWQSAASSTKGPQTAAVWVSSPSPGRSLCRPSRWAGLFLWILQKANTEGHLLYQAFLTSPRSSLQHLQQPPWRLAFEGKSKGVKGLGDKFTSKEKGWPQTYNSSSPCLWVLIWWAQKNEGALRQLKRDVHT